MLLQSSSDKKAGRPTEEARGALLLDERTFSRQRSRDLDMSMPASQSIIL